MQQGVYPPTYAAYPCEWNSSLTPSCNAGAPRVCDDAALLTPSVSPTAAPPLLSAPSQPPSLLAGAPAALLAPSPTWSPSSISDELPLGPAPMMPLQSSVIPPPASDAINHLLDTPGVIGGFMSILALSACVSACHQRGKHKRRTSQRYGTGKVQREARYCERDQTASHAYSTQHVHDGAMDKSPNDCRQDTADMSAACAFTPPIGRHSLRAAGSSTWSSRATVVQPRQGRSLSPLATRQFIAPDALHGCRDVRTTSSGSCLPRGSSPACPLTPRSSDATTSIVEAPCKFFHCTSMDCSNCAELGHSSVARIIPGLNNLPSSLVLPPTPSPSLDSPAIVSLSTAMSESPLHIQAHELLPTRPVQIGSGPTRPASFYLSRWHVGVSEQNSKSSPLARPTVHATNAAKVLPPVSYNI